MSLSDLFEAEKRLQKQLDQAAQEAQSDADSPPEEVDGRYHVSRRSADAQRDRALARLGSRVLRFEAALVMQQPLVAVARIREPLRR